MLSSDATVAVLGVGNIGRAFLKALKTNNVEVTGWNRSLGKVQDIKSEFNLKDNVEEAINLSKYLIILFTSDRELNHVYEVLNRVKDQLVGKILILASSSTPTLSRKMFAWAQAAKAKFVNLAVMSPPEMIGTPYSSLLISGPKNDVDECIVFLKHVGGIKSLGEDPGRAALGDLTLLLPFLSAMMGHFLSLAILRKEEGDVGVYTEMVDSFMKNTTPLIIGLTTQFVQSGNHEEEGKVGVSARTMRSGAEMWLDYLREINVDGGLIEAIVTQLSKCQDLHGLSSVVNHL